MKNILVLLSSLLLFSGCGGSSSAGSQNQAPVALSQDVVTYESTPKAITLNATDADADTLTYAVVTNPAKGTLSGVAPNIVYTPQNAYFGSDSFTFKANDGVVDSAVVSVDITVAKRESRLVSFMGKDDGVEPWITNGTESETLRISDINQKLDGSFPRNIIKVGAQFFFLADDGISGIQLWKSDGSEAGTRRVTNLQDDKIDSQLIYVNGTFFFSVSGKNQITPSTQLWKSDGSAAGTEMVKDIYEGTDTAHRYALRNFFSFNNILYFSADDGMHSRQFGRKLWRSDGSETGTVLFKDKDGADLYNPKDFITLDGLLYFIADNKLYKSDGTEAGTVVVLSSPYNIQNITVMDHTLYFSATTNTNGAELWKSNGTEAGTVLVKDIRVGRLDSSPRNFAVIGTTLYFSADDGTNGRELWKSNGTEAGTVMVKDIKNGVSRSDPKDLTVSNGILYFSADDGINGRELWKSNGLDIGTGMVKDIKNGAESSEPSSLVDIAGTLYFSTTDMGLWKSSGTEVGTTLVKDILNGNLVNIDDTLYFSADDGTHGYELYTSNGTEAGTVMVKNINQTTSSSMDFDTEIVFIGTNYYFIADDGTHGSELWVSNGTEAGTKMVKDIYSGDAPYTYPYSLTNLNGTLYFFAKVDDVTIPKLYKTNGTEAGTQIVKSFSDVDMDFSPRDMVNMNGTLYFSGYDALHGGELWKSDGTTPGTVMFKDIHVGVGDSFIDKITNINGTLYFLADDGIHGEALWKSDGVGVESIATDIDVPYFSSFTTVGNQFYFLADDGAYGLELFKSDGTEVGTKILKDITEGIGGSFTYYFPDIVLVGDTIFFVANDGTHGYELWKSDGTEDGTKMVKELSSSFLDAPRELTSFKNMLYFISGSKLYKSDGTEGGTVIVKELTTRIQGVYFHIYEVLNDELIIQMYDGSSSTLYKSDGRTEGTKVIVEP